MKQKIAQTRVPLLPALVVVGSGLCFSAATVLAGMAFRRGAPVGTIVLGRLTVGALLLWALVAALRIPVRAAGGRALLLLALGALPATQAFLLYQSIARIPTSVATLLLYTYPAIVTVLVIALRRERVNRGKLLALALSAFGLVLVLGLPSERLGTAGIVYGLLSAAALATWIIIADHVTKDVAPLLSTALLVGGGAVSYALLSTVTGTGPIDGTSVAWAVPVGVMASLAVLLLLAALQYVPPTTVSIGSTVEPLSTTVLSAWLLGEALGLPQLLGGLFIVAGVITAVRARSNRRDRGSASTASPGHRSEVESNGEA
jgi:drug/metabolite transporter (DMT)-like permease